LARYRDQRPLLADLTVLHLAPRENLTTIFTLGRCDFSLSAARVASGFTFFRTMTLEFRTMTLES
jgi:hypothetical protein